MIRRVMWERLRQFRGKLAAVSESPVFRSVVPLLILGLYYWALFMSPGARGSSLAPDEARSLVDRTSKLIREDKYQEALEPTLKLYHAYPDSHIYANQAARIFHVLHRYKEEAELWEEFRENAPRPEEACPQIGQAYEQLGSSKDAISAYEWCLKVDPGNTDDVFYLAHALELDAQYDRAAELYRHGLTMTPTYGDLSIGLARVLLHQGHTADAKAAVEEVLQRQPENSDALYVLGLIYLRQDDLANAKQAFEKGVAQAEGNPDFHVALARLAEKQKNIPDAIQHYNRAIELSPEDKSLRARRDSLVSGTPQ